MSTSEDYDDTMEDIDPRVWISTMTIEDSFYGTEELRKLRQLLASGGNFFWRYDFDRARYEVIPFPVVRTGFGFWIATPYEYTLRIGILFDRHQLRIYCWKWILVFGRRDLDILVEANAP